MSGADKDAELIAGLAKYAGVTVTQVAKRAKVDPETLRKPIKGLTDNRLSQRTIEKLQAAYPEFPGWRSVGPVAERRLNWHGPDREIDDMVPLRQIDLRYGLGGTYADGPVEVVHREFPRQWLKLITNTPPRHLVWAVGDGDSMEPTIRSGEVMLIDQSLDTPRMDDGIWAVTHGDIGMVKRLRHLPDGTIELHSDNQLVRPFTAVDGELRVVGRVVGVWRRL